MTAAHYQKACFLLSAARVEQLPPDAGIEVAIVGRSNAGKSSVLNRITQNKGLARVSKTPGRTQLLNIFVLDDKRRLVDLPGYGFAKVPLAAKRKWEETVNAYVSERECLKGLVLVMDIRHPLRELDQTLLEYFEACELPVHLLLNKSDKLGNNDIAKTMKSVKAYLSEHHQQVTVQLFSAMKGTGVKELQAVLDGWYEYD